MNERKIPEGICSYCGFYYDKGKWLEYKEEWSKTEWAKYGLNPMCSCNFKLLNE